MSFDFVIIGLGNIGAEYHKTRHNVGFDVVDAFCEGHGVKFTKKAFDNFAFAEFENLVLVKPTTYMNASGTILSSLRRRFYNANTKLILVVDNMDLDASRIRLKKNSKGVSQKGVISIMENLKPEEDFYSIFVGIGRPTDGTPVVDYVLSRANPTERDKIETGISKAVLLINSLQNKELEILMNEFNKH